MTSFKLEEIPEVSTLASGTRVVVLPDAARGRGLLAAFSKNSHTRSTRCAALLLRGYVRIGAEVDPKTKQDLVFGFAP